MHPDEVRSIVAVDPDPFSAALTFASAAIDEGLNQQGSMNDEEYRRLHLVRNAIDQARA